MNNFIFSPTHDFLEKQFDYKMADFFVKLFISAVDNTFIISGLCDPITRTLPQREMP